MHLVAGKQTAICQMGGNFCLINQQAWVGSDWASPPSGGILIHTRSTALLKQHFLAVETTEDAPFVLSVCQAALGESA
jgi:hypothetical protein